MSSILTYIPAFLLPPSNKTSSKFSRRVYVGIVLGFALSLSSTSLALYLQQRRRAKAARKVSPRPIELRTDEIVQGVVGLIGNTPLVRINSLSDALGVEILGKAEYLNPGGSPKDRVALRIVEDAEASGLLHPHTNSCIFEGTVGSTGISIATIARAKGYECEIVMPDDVAIEKVAVLESLGARVLRVRPASYVDATQFVNLARSRALAFGETILTSLPGVKDQLGDASVAHPSSTADGISTLASTSAVAAAEADALPRTDGRGEEDLVVSNKGKMDGESWKDGLSPRGFFANQFENESNFQAHYSTTGPEILRQTNGCVDAFVSGAGTGGTISGVGVFLKKRLGDNNVRLVLSDPEGSGLFNKVKYGVMYSSQEREGSKRRHQVDTVVEGIGINRITHNFLLGHPYIDDAYQVTDNEAIAMARHLVLKDGLFLGSSSACNLVACVRLIREGKIKPGGRVVTILCDSGSRHFSKFWNDEYLRNAGLEVSSDISAMLYE